MSRNIHNVMLESVACNLCGADDAETIYVSTRDGAAESRNVDAIRASGDEPLTDPLLRCRRCGLEYASPRLSASWVMAGYSNSKDETFVSQAAERERTFSRCLDTIERFGLRPPARVLDVGTANGSFLKVAKDRGWQVSGCEPNRWLAQWCQNNYGIALSVGTIWDGAYQDEEFDAVTLWDVLEHTPDPTAVLRECWRVLKPGGILVVNYPDIGSWISRLMGRKWVFLLSVHYYYFTRQTIAKILSKTGYQVRTVKPHVQTLQLDYVLYRASKYTSLATPFRLLARSLRMGALPMPYWIGQTLVIASKSDSP